MADLGGQAQKVGGRWRDRADWIRPEDDAKDLGELVDGDLPDTHL